MTYVTIKAPPIYHQISLEEFLFNPDAKAFVNPNVANTKTYMVRYVNKKLRDKFPTPELIAALSEFNKATDILYTAHRKTLYNTFYIPKKNKGLSALFKQIFKLQKRFVECNTSTLYHALSCELYKLTTQHPTNEDSEIEAAVMNKCVDILKANGLFITTEELTKCFKDAYRRIDAPSLELKSALTNLKSIFEDKFCAMYHTSAFAYVKNRNTISAIKKHQQNQSRWFAKYDLSNFFGSVTVEFIMQTISQIFPFSEVVKFQQGREQLERALSLCTLDGVLPQGTPISPMLTNLIMIPIDYELCNKLRDFNNQKYVYTRYADDFLISCRYNFNPKEIETLIQETLSRHGAPFQLKPEKTRYGSSAGSNWNLGVMLNKDNQITIGYKNKRRFKSAIDAYAKDKLNGKSWDKSDIQVLNGYINYYTMVEGESITQIIAKATEKIGFDILNSIRNDLKEA